MISEPMQDANEEIESPVVTPDNPPCVSEMLFQSNLLTLQNNSSVRSIAREETKRPTEQQRHN